MLHDTDGIQIQGNMLLNLGNIERLEKQKSKTVMKKIKRKHFLTAPIVQLPSAICSFGVVVVINSFSSNSSK